MLQQITIHHIREKFEKDNNKSLRNNSDYNSLKIDIDKASGEDIGLNTLKRLMGKIDEDVNPRPSTLDMIAKYLGYNFWEHYLKAYNLEDVAYTKATKCLADTDEAINPLGTSQLSSTNKEPVTNLDKPVQKQTTTSIKSSSFQLEEPPVLYLSTFKYTTGMYERKWPLFYKHFKANGKFSPDTNKEVDKAKALAQLQKGLLAESKTYRIISHNITVTEAQKYMLTQITIASGLVAVVLGYFKPDYALIMGAVSLLSFLGTTFQLVALNHYRNESYYWSALLWDYYYNIKEIEERVE